MPMFSISAAYLITLCAESIAYGIHVATFITCVRIWLRRSRRSLPRSTRLPWIAVAVSLMACGTLHAALTCYSNISAFILYRGNDGPDGYLEILSNWVTGARLVCIHLATTISDAALIYRCWLVFTYSEYKLHAAIPSTVLWLAATACGATNMTNLLIHHERTTIPRMSYSRPYLLTYIALTLTQNLVTTGMTVYRLWSVHTHTVARLPSAHDMGRPSFVFVNVVLIEFTLIYSISVVLLTIAAFLGSNWYYCIADVSLQVGGICFNLVLVRLWGVTRDTVSEQTTPLVVCSHPEDLMYNRDVRAVEGPPSAPQLTKSPGYHEQTVSHDHRGLFQESMGLQEPPGAPTKIMCASMPDLRMSSLPG